MEKDKQKKRVSLIERLAEVQPPTPPPPILPVPHRTSA
jgi:hypothetical protein